MNVGHMFTEGTKQLTEKPALMPLKLIERQTFLAARCFYLQNASITSGSAPSYQGCDFLKMLVTGLKQEKGAISCRRRSKPDQKGQ